MSGDSDYNLVTIILTELENITRDNDDLLSGDLLTSSAILNDIAKYVTDHREKLSFEQLEVSFSANSLSKQAVNTEHLRYQIH